MCCFQGKMPNPCTKGRYLNAWSNTAKKMHPYCFLPPEYYMYRCMITTSDSDKGLLLSH